MNYPIKQSRTTWLNLVALVCVAMFCSSCAGPKIAADLLSFTEKNNSALVGNAVEIDVEINPRINNYEKLDDSVKQSLELALRNANIFGADASRPFKIHANILIASQSAWSFGSFEGKLEINYQLLDESGAKILEETIYTEAGSDKWYFSGAKRHRRSRAVNISKNVLQFVDIVQSRLDK